MRKFIGLIFFTLLLASVSSIAFAQVSGGGSGRRRTAMLCGVVPIVTAGERAAGAFFAGMGGGFARDPIRDGLAMFPTTATGGRIAEEFPDAAMTGIPGGLGRTGTEGSDNAASSAATTSCAEANRSCGDLAIIRRRTASTAAGTSDRKRARLGTGWYA